ncbi:zinc finger CCCH domain-containing protein 8 isoform X2 [Coffea arabica]|nr:zinc finger CCCH domain-containing protein 37-like isoform X2 [Coffea arabica]
MANQMYRFNFSSNYGGGGEAAAAAANLYNTNSSRSMVADSFLSSSDASSLLGSSRYLTSSDPLFSSSAARLFSHSDSYSFRIPGLDAVSPTTTSKPASSSSSWPGPPGVDVADPFLLATLKRSSSQALYHQTVFGAHNPIGQTEAWFSTNPLAKRPRFESAGNLPIYPQRPGEKDCAYYMLTRTCKYGDSCKFDHPIWVPEGGIPDWKEVPLVDTSEPLPERPGEPDCPFFMKTQRCKFGTRCKFNHPIEKITPLVALETNSAVLPERPSEPPCAFYMKTGQCKFGATCKFHHPKDLQISTAGQENSFGEQSKLSTNETSGDFKAVKPPVTPAMMHNTKGLPIRLGEVDCPFYLKTGSCKYGQTCRYNHPDRNAINPPAAAIGAAYIASPAPNLSIGIVNPAASILQTFDPRLTQTTVGLAAAIYPQRPGEAACDFYMKTGECKFGQRCKFHHPIDRSAPIISGKETQQENVKLTRAGLPRREGAIHCPYYMKTGTCKYGATCRFDHPPPGEVLAMGTTAQGTWSPTGGEAEEGSSGPETGGEKQ